MTISSNFDETVPNRGGSCGGGSCGGSDRLWPIQFWPIHFGPAHLASQFWQIHFWPISVVSGKWFGQFWSIQLGPIHSCDVLLCVVLLCVGVGCWVLGVGLRFPPLRRTPLRRTAHNFALFFFSRHHFRSFFSLSGVFLWNFGVFEDREPQMCAFGLSDCHVKPRRFRSRQGFT